MNNPSEITTLQRIREALEAAVLALAPFTPGAIRADRKSNHEPVTEADRVANRVLQEALLGDGGGWVSEESIDTFERLEKRRVWIVDPLDGTREFLAGIPERCVSVGMVENGRGVAGGICNPATGEIFLGSLETRGRYNGRPVRASQKKGLRGSVVLASRSEVERGGWECFRGAPFIIRPVGSVTYKLAWVAAGLGDATWTLSPKNEWDVAAGVALVEAAGGFARGLANSSLTFNNRTSVLPGLLAGGASIRKELTWFAQRHAEVPAGGGRMAE